MDNNKLPNTRPLPVDVDILWASQNTVVTMWMNQFGTIPSVESKAISLPSLNKETFEKVCKSIEDAMASHDINYRVSNLTRHTKTRPSYDDGEVDLDMDDDDDPFCDDMRMARVYTISTYSELHQLFDYVVVSMTGGKLTMVYEDGDSFDLSARKDVFDAFVSNESFGVLTKNIMMIEKFEGDFMLSKLQVNTPDNFSYERLYNDDFKPIGEHIEEFITSKKSGIVLLHGTQGTGKTTFLRYLINKHNRKFVYMPAELAGMMSSPSFISFVNDNLRDSVIILEDCENLLRERSDVSSLDSSIINILNMSDGLLGDSMCMKFICTFNSPFTMIDKALTRKGRLVERYNFGYLSHAKTAALIKELYGRDYKGPAMTLSEVFNMETDNHGADDEVTSIGY